MHSFNHYTSVHVNIMHIDTYYWLLEHFEESVKRIILHCYSSDREIDLFSLANFDTGASIYCVQTALKVNMHILLHVLMCNDWMNAFVQKNEVKICEKVLNNLGQLR